MTDQLKNIKKELLDNPKIKIRIKIKKAENDTKRDIKKSNGKMRLKGIDYIY